MSYDLAIVGAGPAGMAAAIEATALGLSVTVLDEQAAPGGQVFRAVESASGDPALAGEFLDAGGALTASFRGVTTIAYRPSSTLWHLAPDTGALSVKAGGASLELAARRVLLATGAQERPVPIPGWTLPGVMSAGAAQILLKTAGAVPQGAVVIAGQGPLCWLLAVQLLRAGVGPLTLLETGAGGALWDAFRAGGLWTGRRLLGKGVALVREAKRRGLQVVRGVRDLRAEGDVHVQAVHWHGGSLPCDTLLLHEGVIPSTHITRALGLEHDWDARQLCWRPRLDAWGATSHPNVAVAGDGGGIGGWEAAVASGRLAAIDAAHRLGKLDAAARDARAAAPRISLRSALSLRPFLDRLYAPAPTVLAPADDTIVCRCEEITGGQIREAARLGATGPNQVKAFLRAGMGPCQGRMCGTVVAALIAEIRGASMEEVGALRPRAPFKPMTVGELAREPQDAAA
ncbi:MULTISPECIES: NAD(P)/FAD-dependent oxidoreductase [unclassified Methylobacterium]|uniref:FAD/NAD(P)-dependent oxidoreductase n=1 Tax=unclassified Methylobacterium TaxID=2615210 RepID=UPI0011C1E69A|nr:MULTISPECIES: NAD(P)/FAD-dependent oxidoreductase [unclassified Methylobacterium]QEE41526.1 FAD-binding protein [Methylobacterium sp. WL1]TXN57096.1 NAD(P)-binding protein [Methylobacterium sp. WL2]